MQEAFDKKGKVVSFEDIFMPLSKDVRESFDIETQQKLMVRSFLEDLRRTSDDISYEDLIKKFNTLKESVQNDKWKQFNIYQMGECEEFKIRELYTESKLSDGINMFLQITEDGRIFSLEEKDRKQIIELIPNEIGEYEKRIFDFLSGEPCYLGVIENGEKIFVGTEFGLYEYQLSGKNGEYDKNEIDRLSWALCVQYAENGSFFWGTEGGSIVEATRKEFDRYETHVIGKHNGEEIVTICVSLDEDKVFSVGKSRYGRKGGHIYEWKLQNSGTYEQKEVANFGESIYSLDILNGVVFAAVGEKIYGFMSSAGEYEKKIIGELGNPITCLKVLSNGIIVAGGESGIYVLKANNEGEYEKRHLNNGGNGKVYCVEAFQDGRIVFGAEKGVFILK